MKLTSTAFAEGQPVPKRYTGEGSDISPPLSWSDAPTGTKSFALICDDPDAPKHTWVHWVLYDVPGTANALPQNLPSDDTLPDGAKQGVTDFKRTGYGGPLPPPGKPHRYFFTLFALNDPLGLRPGASKSDLLNAMEGHVLARASLMGTYQRAR